MAQYETLKSSIQAVIKQNGNNEITGELLQQSLLAIINSLGAGYQFAGIAVPSTNPGTPDQNVFYLAGDAGEYSNFGLSVATNELAVFVYNGSWSKSVVKTEQEFLFAERSPFIKELYINPDGVAAGITHINNYLFPPTGYRVRFSDGTSFIAGTPANIQDINDTFQVLPIIQDNGTTIYGYILLDYSLVESGISVCPINMNLATNIDFSPTIRSIVAGYGQYSGQLGNDNAIAPSLNLVSGFLDMILTGRVSWQSGYYNYAAGAEMENQAFARTKIFPAELDAMFSGISGIGSGTYKYRRCFRSFWKNGIYVGYQLYGSYYNPQSQVVETVDYDAFALNVTIADFPEYITDIELLSLGSVRAVSGKYVFESGYIALGDSTTAGAMSDDGKTSWADIIAKKAVFQSYLKLAIGGATAMYVSGLTRLSSEVANIPSGFSGFITLMIGVNDCGQQNPLGDVDDVLAMDYASLNDTTTFSEAFRYNVETIKRNFPNATLLVMLPLAVGSTTAQWPVITESSVETYRDVERKICEAFAVPYVEPAKEAGISAIVGTTFWNLFMADKVHPNTPGYEKIANYMIGKFLEYCV